MIRCSKGFHWAGMRSPHAKTPRNSGRDKHLDGALHFINAPDKIGDRTTQLVEDWIDKLKEEKLS